MATRKTFGAAAPARERGTTDVMGGFREFRRRLDPRTYLPDGLLGLGIRAGLDVQREMNPYTHLYRAGEAGVRAAPELYRRGVRTAGGALAGSPGPASLRELGAAMVNSVPGAESTDPEKTTQTDFQSGIQAAAAANAEKYGSPAEQAARQAARGTPEAAPPAGRRHPAYAGGPGSAAIMARARDTGAAESAFTGGGGFETPPLASRKQHAIDERARDEIMDRYLRAVERAEAAQPQPMERAIEGERLEAEFDSVADRGNLYAGFDQEGNLASPGSFYSDPQTGTIRNIPGIGATGRPGSIGEEGQKQAQVEDVMAQIQATQKDFEAQRTEIEDLQREIEQSGGFDAGGVLSAQLRRAMEDLERREQYAREFYDRILSGLGVDIDAFYRNNDEGDPIDAVIAADLARDLAGKRQAQ